MHTHLPTLRIVEGTPPAASGPARRITHDERAEGVISLAIAVLIMAVIGAAMFVVFSGIAKDSGDTAKEKVASIK
jgi:hypothetical protein